MAREKYTPAQNVINEESRIRIAWTKRATKKLERIVGAGYAERQIAATLALVEPIDVNIRGTE